MGCAPELPELSAKPETSGLSRIRGPRKRFRNDKTRCGSTGLVIYEEFKMSVHLFSSWEIMPHAILLWTGDLHIDAGSLAAAILGAWLIRTKL